MFGEYGDTFLNTLADYTSETSADVKKMLDAIANKDFDKLQTILESYGMSFAPGVDNVDAN